MKGMFAMDVEQPVQPMDIGVSPFGADDHAGAVNGMTPESVNAIVQRMDGRAMYDLSVDYFLGMPSFQAAGDPPYQIWMTHTPAGTLADDLNGQGREVNSCVAYSGDVILMYTHTGTHIDALNHFGYFGRIYNGFRSDEHLGSRHWLKGGAEMIPPLIARGVLLDVAGTKGVECLPDSYGITVADCEETLIAQDSTIEPGDVVLVRTGRMGRWPDATVMGNSPGLTLETAHWLTAQEPVAVGADNEAVERTPSADPSNWLPVHCHLLAERGVPQMEMLFLEELAAARCYEFGFVGAPIRLRGATGAPLRPLAFTLAEG